MSEDNIPNEKNEMPTAKVNPLYVNDNSIAVEKYNPSLIEPS